MTHRDPEVLSADDCFALLATAPVGRLVYEDDFGPVAIPVPFSLAGRDILLRVDAAARAAALKQPVLAFQADHLDEEHGHGWSVLVRGAGHTLDVQAVPSPARWMTRLFPQPWPVGAHVAWLRLTPSAVAGRRLGAEHRVLVP